MTPALLIQRFQQRQQDQAVITQVFIPMREPSPVINTRQATPTAGAYAAVEDAQKPRHKEIPRALKPTAL